MDKKEKANYIKKILDDLFPHTKTFLHFTKDYELLFAVILSAQATDNSVNKVTEKLFSALPDLKDYSYENKEFILSCIKPVGLGNSKSEYLIKTAQILLEKYEGKLPKERKELMKLPGVGYKTSGVLLAELYDAPFCPVDTHVYRVSHRLGIVKDSLSFEETEEAIEKLFQGEKMISLHRQLILFGRTICKAKNPSCEDCPFSSFCRFYQKKKTSD